jgi:predicted nucleic acid-binding protein
MILFIDTNIFLDVLLNREPLAESSEKVLNICSEQGFKIYTTAISFANISYFVNKFRSSEARFLLTQILNSVHIADTTARDLEKALLSKMNDLEDAYQYFTALKIRGLKYFITRNVKHYRNATIPVLTPEGFIKALNK